MQQNIHIRLGGPVARGTGCLLTDCEHDLPGVALVRTNRPMPHLPAGTTLRADGKALFMIGRNQYFNIGGVARKCAALLPMADLKGVGEVSLDIDTSGLAVAWITLSDKGARGERQDTSGPTVEEMCEEALSMRYCLGHIIPDDLQELKALLTDLALMQHFDLIVTTGGTGVAPRDITPEATLAVIEKRLPGIEHAMTATSLAKTPHAVISRAVAGTLGESIIINLPGSPKAVRECLGAVLPALPHALDKLRGDPSDCAALRREPSGA